MEVRNQRGTWTTRYSSCRDHVIHRFDTTTDTARRFQDKSKSYSPKARTNTHFNYYSEDPTRNCKSKSKRRFAASSMACRLVAINRFQYKCIMRLLRRTPVGKRLSWTSKKIKVTSSRYSSSSIKVWKKK